MLAEAKEDETLLWTTPSRKADNLLSRFSDTGLGSLLSRAQQRMEHETEYQAPWDLYSAPVLTCRVTPRHTCPFHALFLSPHLPHYFEWECRDNLPLQINMVSIIDVSQPWLKLVDTTVIQIII